MRLYYLRCGARIDRAAARTTGVAVVTHIFPTAGMVDGWRCGHRAGAASMGR